MVAKILFEELLNRKLNRFPVVRHSRVEIAINLSRKNDPVPDLTSDFSDAGQNLRFAPDAFFVADLEDAPGFSDVLPVFSAKFPLIGSPAFCSRCRAGSIGPCHQF